MAIVKFIAIHDHSGVANCIKYVDDREKNRLETGQSEAGLFPDHSDIGSLIDYSVNPEKTHLADLAGGTILVSGINCSAEFAKEEFKISRDAYENSAMEKHIYGEKSDGESSKKKKEAIEAYHVIQSFPDSVTDPKLVHHIGKLYAQKMFPGHKCLVSTHMNTKHLHNHIVVCAYETDRPRKFKMNKAAITKMKMINDELSLAYGLPVLSNDISDRELNRQIEAELRRFGSGPVTDIGMSVGEYHARIRAAAWKAGLEDTIRDIASRSASWEDFIRNMDAAGWTIKETPANITYINKENSRLRARGATLGEEFTKGVIIREHNWDVILNNTQEAGRDGRLSAKTSDEPLISNNSHEAIGDIVLPFIPGDDLLDQSIDQAMLRRTLYDGICNLPSPTPKPLRLHIPRYTKWGRRRSDLELIFIAAIRIIAYLKDRFPENLTGPDINDPQSLDYYKRLQTMANAVKTTRELKINTVAELKDHLRDTGAKLSQERAALNELQTGMEAMSRLAGLYKRLKELEQEISLTTGRIDPGRLFLQAPDEQIIQENRASLQPLTPKLRASLFYALKNSEDYCLKFEWKDLDKRVSMTEGLKLLRFLRGQTKEMPSGFLETRYEHEQNKPSRKYEMIRQSKDNRLREKYKDIPISEKVLKKLRIICDANDLRIDPSGLSMYESLQLISRYAKNPFGGELISDDQVRALQKLLKSNRLELNRELHYVTESEYSAIKRYINNPSLHKPDLLKPSLPARPSSIRQIRELMELKGENISIPPEALSQKDANRLFDWLIHRGEPSDIIKRLEAESMAAHFQDTIRNLPPEEQTAIQEYRSILQELINYGYHAEDLETIEGTALSLSKSVQYHDQTVAALKEEYRKLKELARCVSLADDIPASILSEAAHSGLYAGAVSEALLHANPELAVQERLYPEKSSGKVPEKGLNASRTDSYYNKEESIPAEEEELEPTAPSHR